MLVVTVLVLFEGVGSTTPDGGVMVTVLTTGPVDGAVPRIVMITLPPDGKIPELQTGTWAPLLVDP